MFRILNKPENSKLIELSLKQREMLLTYERDKYDLQFPRLPLTRQVAIVSATPNNSPVNNKAKI